MRIYQPVTLGAERFTMGGHGALEKGALRHPVLEVEGVVYGGELILSNLFSNSDCYWMHANFSFFKRHFPVTIIAIHLANRKRCVY